MSFFESVFEFIGDIFDAAFGWLIPEPDVKGPSVTIERQGSDNAIPIVYGEQKVGAIKVHKYVTDTPDEAENDLLHIIAVFCEGEIESIDELFFNELSENDSKFRGGRLGGRWYSKQTYTGAAGQPASSEAVSGIPNWTINHKLSGLAYAYIVFQLPKEGTVWKGEPQVTARVRGRKVYDPRTDTTAYSSNPALCLRDYILNPIYGGGEDSVFPDDASFNYVADICDVSTSNTVTVTNYIDFGVDGVRGIYDTPIVTIETVNVPRFSANIVIDTAQNYLSNINRLLKPFRGIIQDMTSSAKITLETTIEETYGTGTIVDDLFHFNSGTIVDGDFTADSGSIGDRFNRVEVRFPNKEKEFQTDSVFYPEDGNPLTSQWLDEDNGKRQDGSFEIKGITSKAQAIQMAEIIAKRSRFTRSIKLTGMPETIVAEVGDIVAVDSQMMGWTKKPFRVQTVELQESDDIKFTMTEHEDSVYPWSGAEYDEVLGGTWLGNPDNLQAPTGLTLVPDQTLAETGKLTWSYDDNSFVRRYEIQVIDSLDNVVFDVDVLGRSWTVPLLDVGDYTVRVYAISTSGGRSPDALLAFTLTAPAAPSSLTTTAGDWGIEVAPQLAGIGLGTVFEFDFVQGDGTGHNPSSKGRGTTITFTGLLPNNLHTVYARSVNAYGESAWVSKQVTTTNTGAQVAEYIDPIQQEIDAAEVRLTTAEEEIDAAEVRLTTAEEEIDAAEGKITGLERDGGLFASQFKVDIAEQFTEVYHDFLRVKDIDTESRARKQEFFELSTDLITEQGRIDSTITRVDQVEVGVDGNASAISAINLEVGNIDTSLSATIGRVDQVEIDADGNATAISVVEGQVNDPENNTSALYGFVQSAQTTADGNATSISRITAGVTGNGNTSQALLQLDALFSGGGLSARAFLGVDVNSRVTGINIEGTVTDGVIEFIGDKIQFLRPGDLSVGFEWSAADDEFIYSGRLVAADGTFTGSLTAAGGTFTGDLTAAGGTFTGSLTAADGTFTGSLTSADGTFTGELVAASGSFTGAVTGGSFVTDNGAKRVRIDPSESNTFWFGDSSVTTETASNADLAMGSGGLVVNNGAIGGSSFNVVRGSNRLRIDPGTDLIFWFGANSVPVSSQSKANGIFWIASDGEYSRAIERRLDEVVTSISSRDTWITLAQLNHQSLDGFCELTFDSEFWSGEVSAGTAPTSASMQFRITSVSGTVTTGPTINLSVSDLGGGVYGIDTVAGQPRIDFSKLVDNTGITKYVNQDYELQVFFTFTGPFTSISLSTANASLFRSEEVTEG